MAGISDEKFEEMNKEKKESYVRVYFLKKPKFGQIITILGQLFNDYG